jgi:hypothetical protein
MGSNSVNIAISIPMEMFKELEKPANKRRINRSQVCQDAFRNILNPVSHKVQPMTFLVITMGLAFGIGCITASVTAIFDFLFSTTLLMLGGIVLLTSLVTITKELKNIKLSKGI